MIGAIITLSIVAFVSLCINAVLFVLYRAALKTQDLERKILDRSQFIIERNSEAMEDLFSILNKPTD